jgi:tRNA dimethylallyltransferase
LGAFSHSARLFERSGTGLSFETHSMGSIELVPMPLKSYQDERTRKKRVLVIAGPTAVGKTALSLRLAHMLGGEILSADSMQVYRGMDIGTAKVSPEERSRTPHHLIDIRNIDQPFNVAHFCSEAQKALKSIVLREAVPIVVGGTGFYVRALIYGPPSGPPSVPGVRSKLEEELAELGPAILYERLKQLDPDYATKITPADRHKIIRGLEIIAITGLKVTEFTSSSPEQVANYDFRCWFLHAPLQDLYERIEKRCDEMLTKGLLEEVRNLEKQGLRTNSSASQAIGYRQCLEYLDSQQTEQNWEECVRKFKKASRQLARRQFTWFRKEPLFRWLNVKEVGEEAAAEMIAQDFELN